MVNGTRRHLIIITIIVVVIKRTNRKVTRRQGEVRVEWSGVEKKNKGRGQGRGGANQRKRVHVDEERERESRAKPKVEREREREMRERDEKGVGEGVVKSVWCVPAVFFLLRVVDVQVVKPCYSDTVVLGVPRKVQHFAVKVDGCQIRGG